MSYTCVSLHRIVLLPEIVVHHSLSACTPLLERVSMQCVSVPMNRSHRFQAKVTNLAYNLKCLC